MHCANCGQLNEGGRFCVKCGTELLADSETASANEAIASMPETSSQSKEANVYVKKAKSIVSVYGHFVHKLLKKPTLISERMDQSSFVNGLISLILFAITIPFIYYIGLNKLTLGIFSSIYQPSFFNLVIKSIVFLSVLLLIISLMIFLYTKQCKANATFKDVVARFGAFLTIPAAFQLVGLLLAIVQLTSTAMLLSTFGMLGLLCAICLTIYSYRKDQEQGIDAFYGILLTFVIMGIFFRIAGGELLSSLVFSLINPFGI